MQFSWCKVFQLPHEAASKVISLFALSYPFVLKCRLKFEKKS